MSLLNSFILFNGRFTVMFCCRFCHHPFEIKTQTPRDVHQRLAYLLCLVEGRGGKGNIYVWATGNGGLTDDDCNCDGYTTSIYTVSVGCIGDHGLSAYYTELCSSTLAVTFNGGAHREKEENKMVRNT